MLTANCRNYYFDFNNYWDTCLYLLYQKPAFPSNKCTKMSNKAPGQSWAPTMEGLSPLGFSIVWVIIALFSEIPSSSVTTIFVYSVLCNGLAGFLGWFLLKKFSAVESIEDWILSKNYSAASWRCGFLSLLNATAVDMLNVSRFHRIRFSLYFLCPLYWSAFLQCSQPNWWNWRSW